MTRFLSETNTFSKDLIDFELFHRHSKHFDLHVNDREDAPKLTALIDMQTASEEMDDLIDFNDAQSAPSDKTTAKYS